MKKHKLLNRVGSTPPFVRYVSGIFLLLTLLLNGNYAVSQTVLINPALEGGFELGSTFADNGWTSVNDATNTWNVGGTPAWQTGANCAFVSNNSGTAWEYTNSSVQRSFFYRDVVFPAGETNITLSFDWRGNGNDGNWDNLLVYMADVTVTPSNVGPTTTNTTTAGWPGYTNGTTGYYLLQKNGTTAPTSTSIVAYTFTTAQATYAAGSTKRLIFVWKNDGSFGTNPPASVDNISLTSSCSPVVAIAGSDATTSSITANWNVLTDATGYNVQYRVVGSSTWLDAPANPYVGTSAVLSGLTDNTAYEYRVAAEGPVCNVYSNMVSISTTCNPFTIPYFEGFESGFTHNTTVAGCLSQESTTGSQVWTANNTLTDYNRTPNTGSWNAFLRWSNEDWLFIPIQLTGGTSYRLKFFARQDGSIASNSNVSASYGDANNVASMTNSIIASTGIINGEYQQFVGDFTPATSGVFYVGIRGFMNGSPFYISLDDISLTETPPCSAPLSLNASPNSLTSGVLIWSQSSSFPSDGYEYEVRESGAGGSGATGLIASGTTVALDTTALVTGLTANSTYSAYVRANCGVGVYSDWTLASTFTTSYCTPTPEDVDDLGITNVSVGTIDNTTGAETGNYFDYSAMSTDMELGSSQTVAITFETGYVYNTKVWIDFNDDLDFDDANEEVYSGASTSANPTTLMATFDIPVGVNLGSHRMRIGGVYGEAATPCYPGGFFTYGSFEDYTVNIICPTTIPAATAMGVDVCTGNTAQLVATGITDAVLTWYDAETLGTLLTVNDTLNTTAIPASTSFWVEQTYAACPGVSSDRTEVSVTTFDVIVELDVTDITCNGLTNGSVSVGTVMCGTAPFMYSINGMPYGAAPSDLAAGTYSVRVRDANMNESNFMSVTIVEPTYITPAPTTTNASVCEDATSGAIVTAESASITVVGTPVVLSFDLSAQPTEVNSAPGSVISSVTMPALPSGAVVTSVTLNMNNITSGVGSWDSEVRLGTQGSITNSALKGTGTLNSASTFNYTRDLPVSSVDVAGGLVELLYWNSSNDVDPGDDATFPLGNGVATITIEYTIPDPTTVYTWWTASTGGTLVGTGASLETIGTSVVASPAVAGTYTLYAQTESGACVSPMRTAATVQVNTPSSSTVSRVACASPYTFNGQDFTTAGTYTVTIPNAAGCDSVITLNLTFGTPSASSVTRFSCVNPFVFNGQSFTTAGTYTVVIPNISGCDSTITLDLTFGTPTTHTITTVSCASPYTLNGTDYTTAGTFTQLLVNAAGCDSTITLNLTFGTPSDSTVTAHTCASPFTFNGQDYTTAGTYTVVIPNASGCDSTITLNLTFGTPNTSTLTEEACGFYVYNGMTYTQSGTYTHVFTNSSGCDSTVTLNLTINTVSTPVATVDGITLTASGATGSFVWINCANDESVGNGSTFTATENGSYSVIVTTSTGCTAVSECVIVNQVGIDKNEMLSGIAIYPNPTTSNVTISMADDKLVNAKLYDAQGKLINTIKNVKNGTVISLDTLENGVYMIHVSNETGNQVFRIVKQ